MDGGVFRADETSVESVHVLPRNKRRNLICHAEMEQARRVKVPERDEEEDEAGLWEALEVVVVAPAALAVWVVRLQQALVEVVYVLVADSR